MALSFNVFFREVSQHLKGDLPFVLYKYPNDNRILGLLQSTDKLYKLEGTKQSGFIMVPSNDKDEAVIIPKASSKELTCELAGAEKAEMDVSLQFEHRDKQRHLDLVNKGVEAIERGEFQKVVLSRDEHILISDFDCLSFYNNLVLRYPHAFCYLFYHPKIGLWMGASPETLVEVEDQRLNTMALAATVVDKGQSTVQWGEKEKQEQALVTVAILDALREYCDAIEVSEVQTVKAANLYHLQTKIAANLHGDLDALLGELHPTPAVCGLPKLAAWHFIQENEYYNRSYYTGYLGTINMDLQAKLYVNLRCMQYLDQELLIYVGGGITIDSVAELEWEETVNKGRTMLDVLVQSL